MKKIGILHGKISKVIAELAHNETILIGDAGMPCPVGVEFIDLAVSEGVPSFNDVISAIMKEMAVAKATIDIEQKDISPQFAKNLKALIGDEFPVEEIPHAQLQENAKTAKAMIRTGEFTPFANIILTADVLFG